MNKMLEVNGKYIPNIYRNISKLFCVILEITQKITIIYKLHILSRFLKLFRENINILKKDYINYITKASDNNINISNTFHVSLN